MTSDKTNILSIGFPEIKKLSIPLGLPKAALIAAVGFEERMFGIPDEVSRKGKRFGSVIGVEYKPFEPKNRKEDFHSKAKSIVPSEKQISYAFYDRSCPAESEVGIRKKIKELEHFEEIWLDISAMTRMAIVLILQQIKLTEYRGNLRIVYTEAKEYYPRTKKEFEEVRNEVGNGHPLEFLTTGVLGTCTTPSLSTPTMQGYPLMLVTFPRFNPNLLLALKNDLSPNRIILIDGKPHKERNKWRMDALREINKAICEDVERKEHKRRIASTFYYREVIEVLEEIYQEYSYTHKIAVAPAASKLQAVGIFLFKQMHPDIQIVYPTPQKFRTERYTEEVENLWQIEFKPFSYFMEKLDNYRFRDLEALRDKVSWE